MSASTPEGGRLARRLGLGDAIVVGLGAMVGAGVFAAPGPAAAAAGDWLLVSLVLAALVAYANATSSARLAARHPEAGGTYVYARERLGGLWGFLAGWCFVVGKTASLGAMALTFGAYVHAPLARALAVGVVLALTTVNYRGVEKTARLTRVIVVLVVLALLLVIGALLVSVRRHLLPIPAASASAAGVGGVLEGAGLLFFAFAGYARLATLGEEVREPARTIPRAIGIALAVVVVLYALVLGGALLAVGAGRLAEADAPLADAVAHVGASWLAPLVRAGAGVATVGVLLSLLAGVSRTVLAMARRGELPRALDAVHPLHRTPHRAEVAVAVVVCLVVAVADLRGAIGFSSFAVLLYYALTNTAACTLGHGARARGLPTLGLVGCLGLAFALPVEAVVGGLALLMAGMLVWLARRVRARSE